MGSLSASQNLVMLDGQLSVQPSCRSRWEADAFNTYKLGDDEGVIAHLSEALMTAARGIVATMPGLDVAILDQIDRCTNCNPLAAKHAVVKERLDPVTSAVRRVLARRVNRVVLPRVLQKIAVIHRFVATYTNTHEGKPVPQLPVVDRLQYAAAFPTLVCECVPHYEKWSHPDIRLATALVPLMQCQLLRRLHGQPVPPDHWIDVLHCVQMHDAMQLWQQPTRKRSNKRELAERLYYFARAAMTPLMPSDRAMITQPATMHLSQRKERVPQAWSEAELDAHTPFYLASPPPARPASRTRGIIVDTGAGVGAIPDLAEAASAPADTNAQLTADDADDSLDTLELMHMLCGDVAEDASDDANPTKQEPAVLTWKQYQCALAFEQALPDVRTLYPDMADAAAPLGNPDTGDLLDRWTPRSLVSLAAHQLALYVHTMPESALTAVMPVDAQHLLLEALLRRDHLAAVHLPLLAHVSSLNLSHRIQVTDSWLGIIGKHWRSLIGLDLTGCFNISPRGFDLLTQAPSVQESLQTLRVRREYCVQNASFYPSQHEDDCGLVWSLQEGAQTRHGRIPATTSLAIPSIASSLARCTHLRHLDLSGTNVPENACLSVRTGRILASSLGELRVLRLGLLPTPVSTLRLLGTAMPKLEELQAVLALGAVLYGPSKTKVPDITHLASVADQTDASRLFAEAFPCLRSLDLANTTFPSGVWRGFAQGASILSLLAAGGFQDMPPLHRLVLDAKCLQADWTWMYDMEVEEPMTLSVLTNKAVRALAAALKGLLAASLCTLRIEEDGRLLSAEPDIVDAFADAIGSLSRLDALYLRIGSDQAFTDAQLARCVGSPSRRSLNDLTLFAGSLGDLTICAASQLPMLSSLAIGPGPNTVQLEQLSWRGLCQLTRSLSIRRLHVRHFVFNHEVLESSAFHVAELSQCDCQSRIWQARREQAYFTMLQERAVEAAAAVAEAADGEGDVADDDDDDDDAVRTGTSKDLLATTASDAGNGADDAIPVAGIVSEAASLHSASSVAGKSIDPMDNGQDGSELAEGSKSNGSSSDPPASIAAAAAAMNATYTDDGPVNNGVDMAAPGGPAVVAPDPESKQDEEPDELADLLPSVAMMFLEEDDLESVKGDDELYAMYPDTDYSSDEDSNKAEADKKTPKKKTLTLQDFNYAIPSSWNTQHVYPEHELAQLDVDPTCLFRQLEPLLNRLTHLHWEACSQGLIHHARLYGPASVSMPMLLPNIEVLAFSDLRYRLPDAESKLQVVHPISHLDRISEVMCENRGCHLPDSPFVGLTKLQAVMFSGTRPSYSSFDSGPTCFCTCPSSSLYAGLLPKLGK